MDALKNFAYSTVATAPSPATSGTSLVVAAGEGARFPTAPFNAVVWPANTQPLPTNAEVVRVTVVSTDTLTITRAQESSSARSIVVGDQIAAAITSKVLTDLAKVVQIVFASYGTDVSSSSSTNVDTGLTATITPKLTTNKILVLLNQNGIRKTGNNYLGLDLYRDGGLLASLSTQAGYTASTLENNVGTLSLSYLDSPASVSALVYKTQFRSSAGGAQVDVQIGSTLSTLVLIEVTP